MRYPTRQAALEAKRERERLYREERGEHPWPEPEGVPCRDGLCGTCPACVAEIQYDLDQHELSMGLNPGEYIDAKGERCSRLKK